MADKKQAVVHALRGLATSFGELSKAHRTAQSAIYEYSNEIDQSSEPQAILNNFPALFGNLEDFGISTGAPTGGAATTTSSKGKSASNAKVVAGSPDEVAEVEDGKAKRRGPAKEKKLKDPNAPKRPASAYIEYQNHVRDEFRERHTDLPYSDVLKKIGESWSAMTDAQKQPYHDITERKKTSYLTDKKAYDLEHGIVSTAPASTSTSTNNAAAASTTAAGGEGKEYTGKKRGRKSNAERALIAAAAATDAGRAAEAGNAAPSSSNAVASSSKQADIPVNAPASTKKAAAAAAVEESDDDSDDDSDDSDDSSSEESSSSEEEREPTPPPVVVPPKKEKKSSKGDKHKSKKSKTSA